MSVLQSITTSNSHRWLRILGTAAGACIVAAACGGGSIQGAGGPGQGLQEINPTNGGSVYGGGGSSEDNINRTLTVTKETKGGEERIYFRAEGRDTPILWAKMAGTDKLMFAYKGKRYTFEAASFTETLEPDGGSGQLLVGGEMAPGAKVGLAVLEVGDDSGPYMVTVLGEGEEAEHADFILARCGTTACEDSPSGGQEYSVEATTKKVIETVALAHNRSVESGEVNWHLERRPQALDSTTDTNDGWGETGDSTFDETWDNLEPLPETLPGAPSAQPSSDDGGGDSIFSKIGDLFTWDNLLLGAGVLAGGWVLYEGIDWFFTGDAFLGIGENSKYPDSPWNNLWGGGSDDSPPSTGTVDPEPTIDAVPNDGCDGLRPIECDSKPADQRWADPPGAPPLRA